MTENKFDPYDMDFIRRFAIQIDCRPPNGNAYEALLKSERLEREIKSGDITQIDGVSENDFEKIKLGITCSDDNPDQDDLYCEALQLLDSYVCEKYEVTSDELGNALDWQNEQIDLLMRANKLN